MKELSPRERDIDACVRATLTYNLPVLYRVGHAVVCWWEARQTHGLNLEQRAAQEYNCAASAAAWPSDFA